MLKFKSLLAVLGFAAAALSATAADILSLIHI